MGPEFPARSAAELRTILNETQHQLLDALGQLEARARWEVDLHRRLADHALELVVAGFFTGVLLGARTRRRRH